MIHLTVRHGGQCQPEVSVSADRVMTAHRRLEIIEKV